MFVRATNCNHNKTESSYVHSVSRNMTGSVSGETQADNNLKTAGKCDNPTPEKSAAVQAEQKTESTPPDRSPAENEAKEKKTFLPPLVVGTSAEEPVGEISEKATTEREFLTLPRAGGACKKKQLHHSSKSASLLQGRSRMDEMALLNPSSLARRGKAQSYMMLAGSGAADPVFGVLAGEDRGFEDSLGARSELSAPVSAARGRRRRGDRAAFGTLERATSYSSLAATPPRPTFRSANSARPSPAPPCTTTHMDFCRHPVSTSSAGSRLTRAGTPRRNNPHPVGLHFQSPYNRDGKTFEVWNPDENLVANRLPQMCKHIDRTNFTSGKTAYPPTSQGSPDRGSVRAAGTGSVYQYSYRSPQGLTDYDHRMPTTRFGSTVNRAAAVGVVPNVMSPRCGERRVKLHIPRGQKLESLV